MSTKKKSFSRKILGVVSVLVCILILPFLLNGIYTLYESTLYDKPGKMIETDYGNIHVYTKLHGGLHKPVYVFLDGFGGGSAYYDFKMLWEPLSESASIVTIDYLGYGMSEITNSERFAGNIASEIDAALSNAGVQGPYTLVAHSLGGFYAMEYSIRFPDKVASLIFLDNAIPDDVLSENGADMTAYKDSRPIYMLLKYSGLLRFLPQNESPWLSGDELKASAYYERKMLLNRTIMNEIDNTSINAENLADKKAPDSIPELILVSKQNNEASIEQGAAITWEEYHEDFKNSNSHSAVLMLDTGHYMHYEAPEKVLNAIDSFMNTQDLTNDNKIYLIANETAAQIIEAFTNKNIDDTGFPYEEMPPEGIVFPENIRTEISENSSIKSINLIKQEDNSYIAEVLCSNTQNGSGKTFMYVDFYVRDDNTRHVNTIYFSETPINY